MAARDSVARRVRSKRRHGSDATSDFHEQTPSVMAGSVVNANGGDTFASSSDTFVAFDNLGVLAGGVTPSFGAAGDEGTEGGNASVVEGISGSMSGGVDMASQTEPEQGEYDASMTTIAELAVAVRAVAQHASTFTSAVTQLSSSLQRRMTNLEDRMARLGTILEATLDASVSEPPEEAEMPEEAQVLDVCEDEASGGVEAVSEDGRDVLFAPTELDEDSQASVVWVEDTPGVHGPESHVPDGGDSRGRWPTSADGQDWEAERPPKRPAARRGRGGKVAKLLMNAPWRSDD